MKYSLIKYAYRYPHRIPKYPSKRLIIGVRVFPENLLIHWTIHIDNIRPSKKSATIEMLSISSKKYVHWSLFLMVARRFQPFISYGKLETASSIHNFTCVIFGKRLVIYCLKVL